MTVKQLIAIRNENLEEKVSSVREHVKTAFDELLEVVYWEDDKGKRHMREDVPSNYRWAIRGLRDSQDLLQEDYE